MRLVLKNVTLLIIAYAVLLGAVSLWFRYSQIKAESQLIEETLTLLGQEKLTVLAGPIQRAFDPTNLIGEAQLRHEIEVALQTSAVITSITVVDREGNVKASDKLPAGSHRLPASYVFRGMTAPAPYANSTSRSLLSGDDYVLYLPVSRGPGHLAGYLEIMFESSRMKSLARTLNQRLVREALLGLGFIGIAAILLHVQLKRHAERLTRYLETAAAAESMRAEAADAAEALRVRTGNDEFSTVYEAAQKMGQSLTEARREGRGAGRRFGQLSDVLRVGLLWCTPDRKIEFTNQRVPDMTGLADLEEVRGHWERVCAPVLRVMDELDRSGVSRGEPVDLLIGQPLRTLRVQVYRVGTTECEGYIVLLTDPEILESIEEDVHLATQMKSLGRVCRTVVHELRSPLGAMIVNMDLLRESLSDHEGDDAAVRNSRERYVGVVRQEMERLNQTLFEMLQQVAPFTQKHERVDLRSVLRDLELLLTEQARRQHVAISTEISVESAHVIGRRDHLTQALLNIAVNALEAMPQGGRLEIGLRLNEGGAEVRFCDTGPGLPPGLLERIYEMGYSTKESGTGMGLYVARTLVEQHGGTIRARNGGERGACFEIQLPVVAPALVG